MNHLLIKPRTGYALVSAASLAVIVTCVGCGDGSGVTLDAEVTGIVTLDGEVAQFGSVAFNPLDEGPIAYGTINADGSYVLRTGRGDLDNPNKGRLPSGQYVVTVVIALPPEVKRPPSGGPSDPGQQISPEKYARVDTSPLVKSIRPGKNVVNLELVRGDATEAPSAETADATPATGGGEETTTEETTTEETTTEETTTEETTTEEPTAEETTTEETTDGETATNPESDPQSQAEPRSDAPATTAAEEPGR